MIQFNLLPDVKLEYIKTKRMKRTVSLIAFITAASTLAIFILLLLVVHVFQKTHLNNLSDDIKKSSDQLKGIEDLDKVLTIQNQLNSLTALHDGKPVSSRMFRYIQQVTPAKASIADFKLDFETQTITITGSADSIGTVNTYVDTLKFTKYQIDNEIKGNAFSGVVMTSFGRDERSATYQIDMKFDPIIFEGAKNVALVVENVITTRSETEKPDALFQPLSNEEGR